MEVIENVSFHLILFEKSGTMNTKADTDFGEVVEFMLENNCKLEQEAMDLMEIGI